MEGLTENMGETSSQMGGIHEKNGKPLGLPIYNADLQGF